MYVRGIFTSLQLASNSEVRIANQITFNLIEELFQHVNVAVLVVDCGHVLIPS